MNSITYKSEKDIQGLILEYLWYNKIFAWRNNIGGRYNMKFGKKGSGDILGVLPEGKFLSIEVKTKTGKVSKEQKEFIKRVKEEGGIAFVARSLDDVKKNLKVEIEIL